MRKSILSAVLIMASLLCFSCKDDDGPAGCTDWATEVQAEVEAVTSTGTAWSNDPSNTAKCQAYKNALQAYVNALADAEGCANAGGTHAEWQAAIDAGQASVDALQC